MRGEEWVELEMDEALEAGLLREVMLCPGVGPRIRINGRDCINFSSNDYLGLSRDPRIIEGARMALQEWGGGSGASRLMTGTLPCHDALEGALARFKGYPAALVFSSGYAANVGVIPAMLDRDDLVLADRLAHASIIDGAVLSRAELRRFAHNDPADLEERLRKRRAGSRCMVITESVFSMDGDLAPLSEIAAVCARHGAMLMVDEAHAIGVFGPSGSGCVRERGLADTVNVSMGTLSKALGSQGGFVACSHIVRRLLVNRARSFIYSTGLAPAAVGAARAALAVLEAHPGMGSELLGKAERLRSRLQTAGLDTGASSSQIIPVMAGPAERAVSLSNRLREAGVLAVAVRPPTVPAGASRIRLSVSLGHTADDLDRAADAIIGAAKAEGLL